MKEFLEFIPLIAFFIGFKMGGAITAAAALLVATLVVYGIHFVLQKGKLNKQQWIILVITVVFCGITVALNDKFFIKVKSPIINGIFAIALIGSVLVKKPIMKMALKNAFVLTDSGWKKLTLAWAGFFILMAGLHYYTAFHMSDEVWSNFKFWGWIPFMVVFMLGQFMVLKNHINPAMLEQTKDKNTK